MLFLVTLALADTGELKGMMTVPASCVEGEVVSVEIGSVCPAGSTVTWSDESDTVDFGDPAAWSTTWTCPSVECSAQTFHVYAICEDATGRQFWGDEKIEVTCAEEQGKESTGLCSTTGVGSATLLGFVLSALMLRRVQRS